MPAYLVEDTRKVTTKRLAEMKEQGKKIAMLTAYDFTTATIVDAAGVDIILVGDSASNVMAGNNPAHYTRPDDIPCRLGGAWSATCVGDMRYALWHISG